MVRNTAKKWSQIIVAMAKGKVIDLVLELKVSGILNVKNPNTCEEETKTLQYILLFASY